MIHTLSIPIMQLERKYLMHKELNIRVPMLWAMEWKYSQNGKLIIKIDKITIVFKSKANDDYMLESNFMQYITHWARI